jgi:hypothetical protein
MGLCRVTIEMVIEGDLVDATHVVDLMLDAGFFQDAINDHDADDTNAGPLRVRSAVIQTAQEDAAAQGQAP